MSLATVTASVELTPGVWTKYASYDARDLEHAVDLLSIPEMYQKHNVRIEIESDKSKMTINICPKAKV